MASWLLPPTDFLRIPKGPFVFRFSSWKTSRRENNSCNLYYDTITSHGWNIRLRNILGRKSERKWEVEQEIDPWRPNALQKDGDLRIFDYLCHSLSTKKGFVRGEVYVIMWYSFRSTFDKNIQCFIIPLRNRGYREEIWVKCISEFDFTGREGSPKNLHGIRLAIDWNRFPVWRSPKCREELSVWFSSKLLCSRASATACFLAKS